MNKYLQLIKSEKQPPGEGSKGSKTSYEPFEPMVSGRIEDSARRAPGNAAQPSEPFEPASGKRIDDSAHRDPGNPLEPSEPFEPTPDSRMEKFGEAAFWPWAPYLAAGDVARLRAELVDTIERLADTEYWPRELLDDVIARAVRAPLSDLLPNLAHFRERLNAAVAEREASRAIRGRSWNATDGRLADRGRS
ncbi:hypothetical protein [Paraburkholderia pallida]|uniref:Uncharacterized protein n=1 Tax=Paraburkholderia pallida TaxID=2547399 RepID=A0A4P7CP20_9BURK|nr:hypothetical protein [Paraburkholderia pallida]QBQ96296.1 hypothetical protein E1956_03320 [Paraburkholderia pallida]